MRRHPMLLSGGLLLALAIGGLLAASIGSHAGEISFDASWLADLLGGGLGREHGVLLFLRGPRIVTAIVVGAALGVAGLLLQGITRNPLADPYLLGISGGAGLFVVLVHAAPWIYLRLDWWAIPIAAFVGASLAMIVVLQLARGSGRDRGRLSVISLILAGIVINAFCAALMSFLLARFDPFRLRITTTWLYGGIGFVRWPHLLAVTLIVAWCWVIARRAAHRLNAFALGLEGAADVGVDAERLMRSTALLASVLAAFGVSLAGLLGYVGLVVPHAVRLLVGSDFRVTLPATAASGALLLLIADTGARVLFAPEELPVGVLTALIGCPVLLVQLRAQLRRGSAR